MRKKLITMGLVSALGASTSAFAIDLDNAKDTPEVIAEDTLLSTNVIATTTIPVFQAGSLIETTEIGVGIAPDDQNFIRIDLTGAVFAASVDGSATTDCTGDVISTIDGGAIGDDYVVYGVQAGPNGCAQTSEFNLAAVNLGFTGGSAVSVQLRQFEGQTEAINEGDDLYSISGSAVTYGETLEVGNNIAANARVGEVSSNFLRFQDGAGGTTLAVEIGAIELVETGNTNSQNGAATATAADAYTTASSAVQVSGDFSFGTWTFDNDNDCTNGSTVADSVPTISEDFTTATTDLAGGMDVTDFVGTHVFLCVTVDGTDDVINESTYSWTTVPVGVTNGVNTPSALGASLGSISRNGTTVQIPYLTTFEDYNQRLVIVNRGATDATYSITFTTEDDTTATAGTAASGTVAKGSVISLKARDIVSLAGKTRTAATLIVVAPSGNIDVATNQVNLADGSTDTVVLQ
ncbi:MAG: hypothetical protein JJ934_16675 [Pseudomonadales bacterium]|nr:hypothetical protein [Pseudomonadales bacterium]